MTIKEKLQLEGIIRIKAVPINKWDAWFSKEVKKEVEKQKEKKK